MSESPRTSTYRIVVGIDQTRESDAALDRALELARREPAAEVHVVSVASPYGAFVRFDGHGKDMPLDEAGLVLAEEVKHKLGAAAIGPGLRVAAHVRTGKAAQEIAQVAADLEADLVVVGSRGRRGAERLLLGSTAETVVRIAPCPVLVVRPKGAGDGVPEIEPPCPRCVEVRRETQGARLWCNQHSEHHARRHTYHYVNHIGADRSASFLIPRLDD